MSEATERALLQHLAFTNRYNKFAQVYKYYPLLGSGNPKLQKAIRNRKSYLETLSGPQFLKLCIDQEGVSTSIQQTFNSERENYEEEGGGLSNSKESDLQSRQVRQPPKVQRSPQIQRLPQVQSLEIMSSSSRRDVLPAIYGHEEEYELNSLYPEQNPPGVFAFHHPQCHVGKQGSGGCGFCLQMCCGYQI